MTKTLLDIAKENGAKEARYVAGFDVKNEKTEIKDSICFDGDDREAKLKATINAYNAQADLISRDDAIQAIINVGGKRVWEFADAIRYLGKNNH